MARSKGKYVVKKNYLYVLQVCLSAGFSLANTSMHSCTGACIICWYVYVYIIYSRLCHKKSTWTVASLPKALNPGKASTTLSTGGPGATLTNGSASKKLNLPGFRCSEARIFRRMPSQGQGLMLWSFRRWVQICPFLAAKQTAAPSTPIDMAFVTSIASIVLEGNCPLQ